MKQTAIVEAVSGENAKVKVKRDSACAGCKSAGLCNTCYKTITAEAFNKAGAVIGDTVEIETESKIIIGYAAVTFVVPIICALLLYNISYAILKTETLPYIFTFIGFIVPFIILYIVMGKRGKTDIIITKIIENRSTEV